MEPAGPARLPRLTPGDLDEDQRRVYDAVTGGERARIPGRVPLTGDDGALNGPFGVMLLAPGVGDALQQLGSRIRFGTALDGRVREAAILQVARTLDSSFEWYAHVPAARAAGLTEAEISRIADGGLVGASEAETAAADFCRVLLASPGVTDAEFAAVRRHLDDRQVTELTALVGYYRLLAQLMAVYDVGAPRS
ncbi:carboxymuconolactone decarboxylase family protein [Pseudonocardia nematodicida]|uniref:Carboxymuconolactone decarboxylase family protein n=1 Tax=Pseudonocardia nematodicida TaxID=1206997 RepID=A0ABV1K6D8_9PSEU